MSFSKPLIPELLLKLLPSYQFFPFTSISYDFSTPVTLTEVIYEGIKAEQRLTTPHSKAKQNFNINDIRKYVQKSPRNINRKQILNNLEIYVQTELNNGSIQLNVTENNQKQYFLTDCYSYHLWQYSSVKYKPKFFLPHLPILLLPCEGKKIKKKTRSGKCKYKDHSQNCAHCTFKKKLPLDTEMAEFPITNKEQEEEEVLYDGWVSELLNLNQNTFMDEKGVLLCEDPKPAFQIGPSPGGGDEVIYLPASPTPPLPTPPSSSPTPGTSAGTSGTLGTAVETHHKQDQEILTTSSQPLLQLDASSLEPETSQVFEWDTFQSAHVKEPKGKGKGKGPCKGKKSFKQSEKYLPSPISDGVKDPKKASCLCFHKLFLTKFNWFFYVYRKAIAGSFSRLSNQRLKTKREKTKGEKRNVSLE